MALNPAAQLIVDETLEQVHNPFAPSEPDRGASPFARTPFGSSNPFARQGNPFAMPAANPFAARPTGANPFDLTKKPSQRALGAVPKRRVVIHHIFQSKKTDKSDYRLASSSFYMPRSAWIEAFEEDPETYLAQPGDKYDFTELAAANADHAKYEGRNLNEEVERLISESTTEHYGMPRVDASLMSPELVDLFAQEAVVADDPWREAIRSIGDRVFDSEMDPGVAWSAIRPLAKQIFDEVMADPEPVIRKLERRQLDAIYDMAGYERNEDDKVAKDRIMDHVQSHGLGDDSLAEAFGDYVTWNSVGTGADGEHLAYLLQQAAESNLPVMTQEYGVATPVHELFVFDRGFHPDTQLRSGDTIADVGGDYTVHHVMYRSNLSEIDGSVPFVGGIRELYMWPADARGNYLHGGPYADPVYGHLPDRDYKSG